VKIKLIFLSIILLTPILAIANENIVRMVHGTQLDLCKRNEGCQDAEIRRCEAESRGAFAYCDKYLTQSRISVSEFSDCMTYELTRRLGKKTVTNFMFFPQCESPSPATVPPAVQLPRAAELPRYFTATGLDILNTLTLANSAQEGCATGAVRDAEFVKKSNPNVSVDIRLGNPVKTQSINGTPEVAYTHLLKKPTYIYGKCTGTQITTFLKNDPRAGYRKGEKIVANYEPTLYVVADCKSFPPPTVCDP